MILDRIPDLVGERQRMGKRPEFVATLQSTSVGVRHILGNEVEL